jgi:tetratricopeptide (TPR) repeat protein
LSVADSRIDELRRRLERDPGSRLFAQLAEEFRKAGDHADAIRVARTGLAQHPSYPSARLTLGRALLDSGDPGGARAELEATLREAPDNILASRFLGQALEALGELGPALAQLQKTLKMAPGDRQLESQIVSLQTRLRAPQAPLVVPPKAAPSVEPTRRPPIAAASSEVTVPMKRPLAPAAPEAEGDEGEPLPPTIRIHGGAAEGFWGRRAGPPPLPATAGRPTEAPAREPAPRSAPPAPPPPRAAEPSPASSYESDVAPTLPAAPPPVFGRLEEAGVTVPPTVPPAAPPPDFGLVDDAAAPTLPPRAVAVEETVFDEEPAPAAAPSPARASTTEESTSPGGTPFSSSTLAELYLRQGVVDRAVEVYRQVLAEEPGNDRARSRLAEIESSPSPAEARAARRKALERTIAGLEALLAVLQRT